MTSAVDGLQQQQAAAAQAEAGVAAGQGSLTDAMLSATQATLGTELTVAVTNKAISAFNAVMSLQL